MSWSGVGATLVAGAVTAGGAFALAGHGVLSGPRPEPAVLGLAAGAGVATGLVGSLGTRRRGDAAWQAMWSSATGFSLAMVGFVAVHPVFGPADSVALLLPAVIVATLVGAAAGPAAPRPPPNRYALLQNSGASPRDDGPEVRPALDEGFPLDGVRPARPAPKWGATRQVEPGERPAASGIRQVGCGEVPQSGVTRPVRPPRGASHEESSEPAPPRAAWVALDRPPGGTKTPPGSISESSGALADQA